MTKCVYCGKPIIDERLEKWQQYEPENHIEMMKHFHLKCWLKGKGDEREQN